MLDACYSGGFWGDTKKPEINNGEIIGDLSSLNNIAFLASAAEDELSWADKDLHTGIFTDWLQKALTRKADGYLNADLNKDGEVGFGELETYLEKYDWKPYLNVYGYTKELGDLMLMDETNLPTPVLYKSDDFEGGISSVPEPGSFLLFITAGLCLIVLRRRNCSS